MSTMLSYVTTFWKNGFNFKGRSSLEQYYMPAVLNGFVYSIVLLVLALITGLIGMIRPLHGFASLLMGLCSFALSVIFMIACLSATVRRLHDTGRRWYYMFFVLIPIAGIFIFLYFLLSDTSGNALGEPTELEKSDIVIPEVKVSFQNRNTQQDNTTQEPDSGNISI